MKHRPRCSAVAPNRGHLSSNLMIRRRSEPQHQMRILNVLEQPHGYQQRVSAQQHAAAAFLARFDGCGPVDPQVTSHLCLAFSTLPKEHWAITTRCGCPPLSSELPKRESRRQTISVLPNYSNEEYAGRTHADQGMAEHALSGRSDRVKR